MADIQQIYFTTLTAVGEAKDAKAKALGTALKFTAMAVGDGNGVLPVPDRTRTALVREVRRASINTLKQDPRNPAQLIAEQVIPEDEGGWWIRELGLFDSDGDLFAIANCPETYKPVLAQGSGRTQVVRMVLVMTSAASVQLKIDPSIVLATRQYVDGQDAAHAAAADPHPQYLTEAEGQAVAALVNSSPLALDTLAELAAALNNDKDFAATTAAALAAKAPLASPALIGNPTAPTPALFDNDSSVATTEFVKKSGMQFSAPIFVNASRALTAAECVGNFLVIAGSPGPITLTLPAVSACPPGTVVTFLNASAYDVTIARTGADAINNGNGTAQPTVLLRTSDSLSLANIAGVGNWQGFAGTAQLPSSPLFSASKISNGYQKLPSGLILQWGQFTQTDVTGTATGFNFPLPIAFPNAALQAVMTPASGIGAGNVVASVEGVTPTYISGFTWGGSGARLYRIFAIGY